MANSVDFDQMLHPAASDLGLHFCLGLSVPILRVVTVVRIKTKGLGTSDTKMSKSKYYLLLGKL